MTINEEIRHIALGYLDQEEIAGNAGFKDPRFEAMMVLTGWKKGQAWCAYFVELVYREAGLIKIAEILSGGAVDTWNRAQKSDLCICSKQPIIGSIVIWQAVTAGKTTWNGHAGIVVAYNPRQNQIISAEGNTDGEGGREGVEVALKIRPMEFNRNEGLRMLGFITPKEILNN
jgi:hypothetical protein